MFPSPEILRICKGITLSPDFNFDGSNYTNMKKLRWIALILPLSLVQFSYAQIRSVPSQVTESLKTKYPNAANVTWKDKITSFLAIFDIEGKKYEARFDSNGNWLSTETEIEESELPEDVKDGFEKSKYADWSIRNVYNIELPDNVLQYRILVAKNDLQRKNLLYSTDGRLIRDNITLNK